MMGMGALDNLHECFNAIRADNMPGDLVEAGDMYESTIVVLNALYPKVSPGGFVIIYDYGMIPGAIGLSKIFVAVPTLPSH